MTEKQYARVEGHPFLVKDLNSGAVLNTDNRGLAEYKKLRTMKAEETNRLNRIENSLAETKKALDDLKDLKELILKLVQERA